MVGEYLLQAVKDVFARESECIIEMEKYFDPIAFAKAVELLKNATRIALSYGRQREGLLCVGGVCRYVPAATGASISISTSF